MNVCSVCRSLGELYAFTGLQVALTIAGISIALFQPFSLLTNSV